MNEKNDDELNEFMKELEDAEKMSSSNANAGSPAPAWGGARSQGVPVPQEFDQITGLGPATAVYGSGKTGLFFNNAGISFGSKAAKALVLYRDGFAYRSGAETIRVWRWDEVSVIMSNADFQHTRNAYHSYTLTKQSGETLTLDETLENITDLIEPIKRNVYAHLLPPVTASYNSGAAILFGPLTIQRQNGLQMGGKSFRWEDIMDIKIVRGQFTITLRDSRRYEVRTATIPNVEMLCRIIGLKFNPADLIYY